MDPKKEFKKKIIQWNNMFPLDNWYREKYNIPYNSKIHRETNQIDIMFEYYEMIIFKKHFEKISKVPDIEKSEEIELFDDIDINQFSLKE